MRQKRFVAHKKHHKRRRGSRLKMKLFEQGKLKYEELPKLAKRWLARKRRHAARTAA